MSNYRNVSWRGGHDSWRSHMVEVTVAAYYATVQLPEAEVTRLRAYLGEDCPSCAQTSSVIGLSRPVV